MKTVKQYVLDAIKAYDNSIDITDSSVLSDLLVNPGAMMLEPVIAQVNYILDNLGLLTPESIYSGELDQIGSSFLVFRNKGSKSSGNVELFYNVPTHVEIPLGTKFTTIDGQSFVTERAIYISQAEMSRNTWNYPKYSTGAISVVSETVGLQTAIGPNKITSTNLSPAPAQVTNAAGFSGGSDAESNTTYVQRLINEVITGALGSAASIETTLQQQFPTIKKVSVKGMGDTEMLRDLVVNGTSLYGLKSTSDFYGKVSGLNEPPYPQSRAYFTVFYDDPTTSGIVGIGSTTTIQRLIPDLPSAETLEELTINEFTTEQYAGVYNLADAEIADIQTLVVFKEDFGATTLPTECITTDAKVSVGTLAHPNEIAIESKRGANKLRLGSRANGGPAVSQLTVPVQFIYDTINNLREFSQSIPPSLTNAQPGISNYQDYLNFLTYMESL